MFEIKVNGKLYQSEHDMPLMDFLRDTLHIISVKNGCKEGACGACSLLVDGRAVRSCMLKLSKLVGKEIQTIEGFSEYEREVFAYAFMKCGAVQCGFCIPGMVIAAKGLFNKTLDPSLEEVRDAIKMNICRCTGYKKIENAILLSAQIFREKLEVPKLTNVPRVGQDVFRVDAHDKALGMAPYADDYHLEGMLYGKNLFTKCARAKINAIDISEAEKMPGVVAIFTAKDIPGSRYIGHLAKDWPGMIAVGEETKFIGDTLAMVVANTYEEAVAASQAIKVDYEELPPVTCPEEAMLTDAPLIHGEGFMQFGKFREMKSNLFDRQVMRRGNVEDAFAKAAYIEEDEFYVPFQEHAFMEPETAIGVYNEDIDGVTVISGGQGIYDELHEVSDYLGLPQDRVRIKSAYVGGGFGGKEDMSVQHQAALCAYLLKRPVKVRFTRQESINYHPKRHAMRMFMKMGCDKDGNILALKAKIISDTGAYASLGGPVLQRACTHAPGPYHYPNVDIEGEAYYTNNPPAGAFRGFGVTQSMFAVECLVNKLAEKVGLDGWQMRYKNAIRPFETLPNGQIVEEDVGMIECLEAVKEDYYRYENDDNYVVGIGAALKNAGIGVGLKDPGRCNLEVKNGKILCHSSAAPIGQGLQTVIYQMVGNVLTDLDPQNIVICPPDTFDSPDAGTTTASRQTVFTGNAARLAALQLKEQLDQGKTLADLEGRTFYGEFDYQTDPITSDKPNPVSHISYGYACQLFVLEKESGKVHKCIAAHDVGKVVNPRACEGQVEGGVAMGAGYALTEDYRLNKSVPAFKYGNLGLMKSTQVPDIKTILIGKNPSDVAFGAKGIGEITCCVAAQALQNAYYKLDGNFRTSLPLENTYYRKPKKIK